MAKLGIMQGRLLPKYQGRYQAHPVGYWQEEFPLAKKLGFKLIEWIVDLDSIEENPIVSSEGRRFIMDLTHSTGVEVQTLCADCFMDCRFHSETLAERDLANLTMDRLVTSSHQLGIKHLVLPLVDRSRIENRMQMDILLNELSKLTPTLRSAGIRLEIESDLGPDDFKILLDALPADTFGVNYDIGNSASLGFDSVLEMAAYGPRVGTVHVKDRPKGGFSVPLGTGSAQFPSIMGALKRMGFDGPMVFQAFRDEDGPTSLAPQLSWFREQGFLKTEGSGLWSWL